MRISRLSKPVPQYSLSTHFTYVRHRRKAQTPDDAQAYTENPIHFDSFQSFHALQSKARALTSTSGDTCLLGVRGEGGEALLYAATTITDTYSSALYAETWH